MRLKRLTHATAAAAMAVTFGLACTEDDGFDDDPFNDDPSQVDPLDDPFDDPLDDPTDDLGG